MKEEYQHLPLVMNEDDHQFEMEVEGAKAIIVYQQNDNVIKLLHTEVPQELEGRGIATAIIEKTLMYLKDNNLRLIPLCPMVVAYVKRHPEWEAIVEPRH